MERKLVVFTSKRAMTTKRKKAPRCQALLAREIEKHKRT
jgi:hypothetical protein